MSIGSIPRVWEKGHFGLHRHLRFTSSLVVQRAWHSEICVTLRQIQLSINNCAVELEETYRINAWGRNLAK